MLLFVAFTLIGLVWLYARELSQRLEELRNLMFEQGVELRDAEGQIKILQRTATVVSAPGAPHPPPPAEQPAPPEGDPLASPLPPPLPTPFVTQPTFVETSEDKAERQPASESVFQPARALPSFTERIEASGGWEEAIGGNLLNKLGALILVIGVALFLSYSFAHMGPLGIASTAAVFSATTLLVGMTFERRERYRAFSRGLIAAGWAGLYFTAYAIYALPAAKIIDSPTVGMGLMVLVAAGMVAHSLRYRVQSLTSLAFGCVFGALALSSQNTLVAFALIPLAASMLFLARRFHWYGMSLLSAAATYATFLTRPSTNTPLGQIQILLLIFWLMFEAFDLMRVKAGVREWPAPGALFGLNALAGLGASAALWYRLAPDSMWQFSCGAALLYLASTWIRLGMDGGTLYEFSLMISALFAGLAIFAGGPGIWISLGVMAEAEVLFLAGRYLSCASLPSFQ